MYENGRGITVDYYQAHQWCRKAAVQGDGLAIGNLGMLFIRGQGIKPNKVAGLALLLFSVELDSSAGNSARQNITATRGLSADMIQAAQLLAVEMSSGVVNEYKKFGWSSFSIYSAVRAKRTSLLDVL
jgi:TPR repeat protein